MTDSSSQAFAGCTDVVNFLEPPPRIKPCFCILVTHKTHAMHCSPFGSDGLADVVQISNVG